MQLVIDEQKSIIDEYQRLETIKKTLDGVILHDLKSPMFMIRSVAKLIINDQTMDIAEIKEFVDDIYTTVNKSINFINSVLALVKIEQGKAKLSCENFLLLDTLNYIKRNFQQNTLHDNQRLKIRFGDNPLEAMDKLNSFSGEENLIRSTFVNLIKNAFEAIPEDTEPDKKVVKLTISFRRHEPNFLHFDIHNPGVIPEELRIDFFGKFKTAGKKAGTGLGTYSAAMIVRHHGGTIDFTTDESEGTHLLIKLPIYH